MNDQIKLEEDAVAASEFSMLLDHELKSFCHHALLQKSGEENNSVSAMLNGLRISTLFSPNEVINAGFSAYTCGLTIEQALAQFLRFMYIASDRRARNLRFFDRRKKELREQVQQYKILAEYAQGSLPETPELIVEKFTIELLRRLSS